MTIPGSEGSKYKRNTAELLEQIQTHPEMEGFMLMTINAN